MTTLTTTPRVALISGSSQGLGFQIARLYAERGIDLILTARSPERLEAARQELSKRTRVVALPGDVVDAEHVARLVSNGLDAFGPIDVLINNASELGPSPMPELRLLDPNSFARILDVNLIAPLRLIQHVLPAMRARREGLIVNVTSDAGVQAYPTWGGYGASKAGLEHLSRVLASELEGTGVRVYVVDPGDMDTVMHHAAEPGEDLSHLPTPDRIAPAFVQLLEETAPFGRFEAQQMLHVPA
jgi:NAD(P)-dependent dehydrogenase (short-subunit alcohol dehydrogenase family)